MSREGLEAVLRAAALALLARARRAVPVVPPLPPHFVCPACGARSFHPEDISQGYCGRCHAFTGNRPGNPPGPVA